MHISCLRKRKEEKIIVLVTNTRLSYLFKQEEERTVLQTFFFIPDRARLRRVSARWSNLILSIIKELRFNYDHLFRLNETCAGWNKN